MLYYTVGQQDAFLVMLCVGIALGALLHLTDCLRTVFGAGVILSATMDLLYSVAALVTLALALLRVGDGEIRPYQLLAALIGFILYLSTVRPAFRRAATPAGKAIGRGMKRLAASTVMRKIFK